MRRVLLVRHAECHMNLEVADKVGGRSNDSPLTSLGVKQAQALGHHLVRSVARHPQLGPCFASTAVRAQDTLQLALEAARRSGHEWLNTPQGQNLQVVHSDEVLELSQGQWEGARRDQCYTPAVLAEIQKDPWNFAAPGGESQRQVEERMTRYITEVVLPQTEPGGPPALVVTHGLAIKCFLRGILGSNPLFTRNILTGNTSVAEVAWQPGGKRGQWQLLRVNDICHLLLDGVDEMGVK